MAVRESVRPECSGVERAWRSPGEEEQFGLRGYGVPECPILGQLDRDGGKSSSLYRQIWPEDQEFQKKFPRWNRAYGMHSTTRGEE